jgi:hypothetical protein
MCTSLSQKVDIENTGEVKRRGKEDGSWRFVSRLLHHLHH